jgi:hypothetical protein
MTDRFSGLSSIEAALRAWSTGEQTWASRSASIAAIRFSIRMSS